MSSKFTCRFCKEQFDQPKGLYKHLQTAHSAGSSSDNRTCPICGVLCSKYEGYRDHLLYIHGQSNEGQKLTFKTLNEFLLWKSALETKFKCKYVLQSAPKILSLKEKKYFYQCDSSNPDPKDGKKVRSVVMKSCSSVISVVDGPGIIKVEHWDTHSNHVESQPVSVEKELEAAISSVEMVNAIGESDDSFDKPEESADWSDLNASSPVKKKSVKAVLNNSAPMTSTPKIQKNVGKEFLPKPGSAKKKTAGSSSILHSLASVACGKGIVKKPDNEKNEPKSIKASEKSSLNISATKVDLPLKKDSDTVAQILAKANANKSNRTLESNKEKNLPKGKASAGPLNIAPKVTTTSPSTGNASLVGNTIFPNQLVLLPAGLDPNSLNSNQNIVSSGQNILFSLPLGQNFLPSNLTIQPVSNVDGKSTTSVSNAKSIKSGGQSVVRMSSAPQSLLKNTMPNPIFSLASTSTTSTTSTALQSNLKKSPVILNSLPVGSTFVSVNNSLIPIATPSGTLLPTSLPPNLVLTPVAPTSTAESSKKILSLPHSTKSSPVVQNHVRFSVPAVTVSSVVSAPIFSSAQAKGNTISLTSSATSLLRSSNITSNKGKKTKPITISHSNLNSSPMSDTAKAITPILNKIAASGELSITTTKFDGSPAKKAKTTTKAKKRVSSIDLTPTTVSSIITMPTKSTLVSKSPQKVSGFPLNTNSKVLNNDDSKTLIFESSGGDVFIMQPITKDGNQNVTSSKPAKPYIAKRDKSVQTTEALMARAKTAERADNAVMMKVKLYQLEMNYLSCLTECKKLKVELTKEKLKNAELSGEKIEMKDDDLANEESRNKAQEIMQEIEDKYSEKPTYIYTMTKTSVLQGLYEDLEDLSTENKELLKELENYRAHDKFYKSLKRKLDDEDFES